VTQHEQRTLCIIIVDDIGEQSFRLRDTGGGVTSYESIIAERGAQQFKTFLDFPSAAGEQSF
jgi:hypothetical protein